MKIATRRALLPLSALAFLLTSPAHGAGVVVVDPAGGPGGAALLQAAINAAQSGDILLLRPGDYTSGPGTHPKLGNTSLTLIVDGPPGSVVLSGLEIIPVAGTHSVLVRGLHVAPAPGQGLPFAAVYANPPATGQTWWFEDCVFTGSLHPDLFSDNLAAQPGLFAGGGGTRLTVVRSTITGGDGQDEVAGMSPARPGAAGVQLGFLTAASVHECTIQGGAGGDGDPFVGGNPSLAGGGTGLYVAGGSASVLGGSAHGGDEGIGNPSQTMPGPGLQAAFATADVRGADIQAGDVQGDGTPAEDISLGVAILTTFPAAPRSLSVPGPIRAGQSSALHVHGEPGDGVFVYMSTASGGQLVTNAQGNYVLGAPLPSPVFLGTIADPSGDLAQPFVMPSLPAGFDGSVLFLQGIMAPAAGGLVVGSGSALVWIDGSF